MYGIASYIHWKLMTKTSQHAATVTETAMRDSFLKALSSWSDCQLLLKKYLDDNSGWKFFKDGDGVYLLVANQWALRPRKEEFPLYIRSRRRETGDEAMFLKAGVVINSTKNNRITGKILNVDVLKKLLA
jgi:hypothetical protein